MRRCLRTDLVAVSLCSMLWKQFLSFLGPFFSNLTHDFNISFLLATSLQALCRIPTKLSKNTVMLHIKITRKLT